jgi:phosphoglycerate dehydrogenase-like enzyme
VTVDRIQPLGQDLPAKPTVAFAYRPDHAEGVFDRASLLRITDLCSVLDPKPMTTFETEAAQALLRGADILVTSWGSPNIDRAVLSRAPKLQLVAHAAGSVKHIVTPEVFAAGIAVTNAASANAIPVAEFTVAAILFANKQVFRFRDLYRQERARMTSTVLGDPGVGNNGKTVGIVGYSRIGARVIELLQPYDFEILLYDPYHSAGTAGPNSVRSVGLDELMSESDVVSLHAPALESTTHMIGKEQLARMKDGATLINTARGALIDHEALVRELVSGRISAMIDVTTPEVLPADSPLYGLPNVLLTPHIAGALGNERSRLGATVADEIERFIGGRPLAHAVAAETLHLQA